MITACIVGGLFAAWFLAACIAGPFIGRCIRRGRGPQGGGQK
jgi:hypothetical protein